ncbi:MAG: hypothetical protein PW844_17345 [Pantoea sp.]|uniref:hypothetical protein n=1 Tax=Pantoea sp. TaxID=69393 RepID=UPI0023A3FBEE|nr:hypothetical protein [Pantoea sp.]MDE1188232.1 hypothetical protein [Pantoea sp.]
MSNETNMSASLAKSINDHCRAFEASDEFGEMVHSHVRKLYEDAIKDVFRWGKFPDAVKKALEEALPGNISEMADLSRYNLLLARSLQDEWNANAVSERTVSHMQQLVKDFIEQDKVPKFIKASDLWAAFIEEHQEEAAHEQWGRPEVIVKTDSEYGKYFQIGLCKEPAEEPGRYSHRRTKTEYFECDTHLGFSLVKASRDRDAEPLMQDGHEVYSLYTGKLEYSDTLGKRAVQFRSQFERLVGALYYGDSLLVLDDEADDIYYPGEY